MQCYLVPWRISRQISNHFSWCLINLYAHILGCLNFNLLSKYCENLVLHLTIESVKINVLWNVNQHPSQKIRAVACTSGPIRGRLNWSENEVRLKYHAVALIRDSSSAGRDWIHALWLPENDGGPFRSTTSLFCFAFPWAWLEGNLGKTTD